MATVEIQVSQEIASKFFWIDATPDQRIDLTRDTLRSWTGVETLTRDEQISLRDQIRAALKP